jgi:hypothetical protein
MQAILRRVRETIAAVEKQLSTTHSEFVSATFFIQHEKRMRRIVVSFVACLTLPYFSTYLIDATIFEQKTLLNTKYVR